MPGFVIVWVFGFKDAELNLPKLLLFRVFGYEDAELILPKLVICLGFLDKRMQSSSWLVLCLDFWIRRCRAHPAKVVRYFVWDFGYEDAELILPKLVLCLGFLI